MPIDVKHHLPESGKRDEYFRFFDGQVRERGTDEWSERARPLFTKSYILEAASTERCVRSLSSTVTVNPVDSDLYTITRPGDGGPFALLDTVHARFPIVHTLARVQESDPWIRKTVASTVDLDHLWISAAAFNALWSYVKMVADPEKVTQIKFKHDALFSAPKTEEDLDEELEEIDDEEREDGDAPVLKVRRSARMGMVDSVGEIGNVLTKLKNAYAPLHSITMIRMPSLSGGGGCDVYYNGKVKNATGSFDVHYANLDFLINAYSSVTRGAEGILRQTTRFDESAGCQFVEWHATPVFIKFSRPLTPMVFESWINAVFRESDKHFRLWGQLIKRGKNRYHVYAVDRHLYQPIDLELTTEHVVAILAEGTCANTIHRLVTNIQQFLAPDIEVYVGDIPYEDLWTQSMLRAA